MRQRRARIWALSAALLLLAAGAVQAKKPPAAPKGDAEFREGWLTLVSPSRDPKLAGSLDAQQKAQMASISHFEAAVAANPENAKYQGALAYACLTAGRYQKAKTAIDLAIDHQRKDPQLYLLRGQAEAALAMMDPVKASKDIGKAVDAFDRAGQLDPKNALPLLQAVSVALYVDRLDLAQPRLKEALARPESRLYQLPVPTDLVASVPDACRIWETLQLMGWQGILARGRDVSTTLIRLGNQEEANGAFPAAQAYYHDAYLAAKKVGQTQPRVMLVVGVAIDTLDRVYFALAHVMKAQNDPGAERWEGERGVLSLCRTELQQDVQTYLADLQAHPPDSVESMLAREAAACKKAYNGAGMELADPTRAPQAPAEKPAEAPASAP
jgi:tetratricopeptide (TPR) repeat protein